MTPPPTKATTASPTPSVQEAAEELQMRAAVGSGRLTQHELWKEIKPDLVVAAAKEEIKTLTEAPTAATASALSPFKGTTSSLGAADSAAAQGQRAEDAVLRQLNAAVIRKDFRLIGRLDKKMKSVRAAAAAAIADERAEAKAKAKMQTLQGKLKQLTQQIRANHKVLAKAKPVTLPALKVVDSSTRGYVMLATSPPTVRDLALKLELQSVKKEEAEEAKRVERASQAEKRDGEALAETTAPTNYPTNHPTEAPTNWPTHGRPSAPTIAVHHVHKCAAEAGADGCCDAHTDCNAPTCAECRCITASRTCFCGAKVFGVPGWGGKQCNDIMAARPTLDPTPCPTAAPTTSPTVVSPIAGRVEAYLSVANRTMLFSPARLNATMRRHRCFYYCYENPLIKEQIDTDGAARDERTGRCKPSKRLVKGDTMVLEQIGWFLAPCYRRRLRQREEGSRSGSGPGSESRRLAVAGGAGARAGHGKDEMAMCKNYFTQSSSVVAKLGFPKQSKDPLVHGVQISLAGA